MPNVTTNFVMGGAARSGATIITNEAGGLGANLGGGRQVVTSPGGVNVAWFHMQ
jgi:hypothetical protein